MPAQHDELAGDRDRRDLCAATRTDSLPERPADFQTYVKSLLHQA
jgi:hypothetical protein